MSTHPEHDLIERIEAFLSVSGMKPTAFGKLAIGDANLLAQLKAGRELRRVTRARIINTIIEHPENETPRLSEAS
jgi:hypothetical protein